MVKLIHKRHQLGRLHLETLTRKFLYHMLFTLATGGHEKTKHIQVKCEKTLAMYFVWFVSYRFCGSPRGWFYACFTRIASWRHFYAIGMLSCIEVESEKPCRGVTAVFVIVNLRPLLCPCGKIEDVTPFRHTSPVTIWSPITEVCVCCLLFIRWFSSI